MNQLPDIITHAEVYKDNIVVPATLFVTYPSTDTDCVTCGILFDTQQDISQVAFQEPHRPQKFQIRSSRRHNNLWIPRMRVAQSYREHMDTSIRGVAELMVEGDLDGFQGKPGTLKCFVLLQDNPLLSFYDEEHLTQWETPFGTAKLIYDYRFGGYILDMSERKPSKRNIIALELNPTQYTSLYDLISNLSDYLDDLMWLISFFCKKYIHWYQFDMFYEPEAGVEDRVRLVHAYSEPIGVSRNPATMETPGFENHPAELLIDLNLLRTDVGSKVFTSYFESRDKDIIRQLMITVMITYGSSVFEQDLGMIYVALEILVNAYTDENILNDNEFGILRTALEDSINSQQVIALTSDQRKQIKKKLSELRRFAYTTRLQTLFKDKLKVAAAQLTQVTHSKITPKVLMDRMFKAVQRRNEFIHQGKISDWSQSSGDFALIRFLVGVYILYLLGYPLDRINSMDGDLGMVDWAILEGKKIKNS